MPTLSHDHIAHLLAPYLGAAAPPPELFAQLSTYLDLLLKWNARTNLTAIRDPEAIVQRHFGESLFAGVHLFARLAHGASLLDFGSGAGFPGLPIQLLRPDLRVTLAESQGKKASFLREVIRTLDLRTEVWADRVEAMPPANSQFDAITLRAVDQMDKALAETRLHVRPGGLLVSLVTSPPPLADAIPMPGNAPGWVAFEHLP